MRGAAVLVLAPAALVAGGVVAQALRLDWAAPDTVVALGDRAGAAAAVTVACLALALPLAFALATVWARARLAVAVLLGAACLGATALRETGFAAILARAAPDWAWTAPWAALVHLLMPGAVFLLLRGFARLDSGLVAAARVAGAGRWQVFAEVTWPLSMQAVAVAAVLVFAAALGLAPGGAG